jgi:hypothetical protein
MFFLNSKKPSSSCSSLHAASQRCSNAAKSQAVLSFYPILSVLSGLLYMTIIWNIDDIVLVYNYYMYIIYVIFIYIYIYYIYYDIYYIYYIYYDMCNRTYYVFGMKDM